MRRIARTTMGALAMASILALPACGGSSSGSSGAPAAAKGEPLVIGTPNADNGNGFLDYYVTDGLTAWAKSVNASGGILGRPVELVRCNDKGSTEGATQCTRDQVTNSKILIGTGFSPFASSITGPGFIKAGIPWLSVAGNSAADLDSTGATLCIVPSAIGSYQAIPTYAIKTLGLKRVAQIRLDVPQLNLVNQEIQVATKAAGGELVANIAVPFSAADFSAPIQQAIAAKAQILVMAETVPATIKIIQTATSLGYTGTIAFGSGYYDRELQKVITTASKSGIKFLSNADFPDHTSSDPDVTAYRNAMTKYGFEKDLGNDQAASGWGAGQFMQKMFETLGKDNINRESIQTFLTTQTIQDVPTFAGPVGRANGTETFPGLGNIRTYMATIDADGRKIQEEPIDVSATTALLKN